MGKRRRRHIPRKEREYWQAVSTIDRTLHEDNYDGLKVRKSQRVTFERFRDHPNERVREYFREIAQIIEESRERREGWEREDGPDDSIPF